MLLDAEEAAHVDFSWIHKKFKEQPIETIILIKMYQSLL